MCTRISVQVVNMAGFGITVPNHTFGISRNTKLKYLNHCGSAMLDCSNAVRRSTVLH